MKKIFNFMLAIAAIVGVACTPNNEGNGGENNGPKPALTFTIQLSNITSTSVKMEVTPSNNTDTYYFDVVETSVLSHYSSPKAFVADYISQLKALYEEHGLALGDVLSQGPDSWEYEEGQLEPNTDYYAFAFGVTAEGVVTSEVTMESFKTLEPTPAGPSDNVLSVSVTRVTANGALVNVTPSNNDTYYFDVIEKSAIDEFGSPLDFALDYIVKLKNTCEAYGYTLADALSSGSDEMSYDGFLSPNTEYYAFAFGATADCAITTEVVTVPFKTSELEKSDKVFDNLSYGFFTNYGDYYGSNATNWYIDIFPEEGMDFLVLEVQTPLDATDFTGNYPFASTFEAGTAVAGFIDFDSGSQLSGSYWATLDLYYNISNYALCKTGNVAITKSGEEYTVAVDAVDADGYKVTANYTGVIEEFIDDYAAPLSVKKQAARRFRFVPKNKELKVAQPLCKKMAAKFGAEKIQPRFTRPFRVAVK